MIYKTRKEAAQARRRFEVTVKKTRHDMFCLISDGLIVPKRACTCGGRGTYYTNVMARR